jgi:hypothetical protein
MAGPFDFTGQNIENTYQRVLQTDGTNVYDGTGSLFILPSANTSSLLTTASFNAWTGSNLSQFSGTSSFATTASYALNGGVTQIIAGNGVTISPSNGLGNVTINSTAANYNTATGSYGSFYDTGSQTAVSNTIIYSMSLSTTDISNGVYVSGSDRTRIYFSNAGIYNVQFSAQFSNTGNNPDDVSIWIRKNDVGSINDIPDSSGVCTVPAKKGSIPGQLIASWNYLLTLAAGDFVQLCWHTIASNEVTLETIPAGTNPPHPRTPSLILTAQRVDTFLSNTGSFSGSFIGTHTGSFTGSFTGSLLGTSSWADSASQALTASYYQETDPIFVAKSASLATTGSNTFVGDQVVSGSFIIDVSSSTDALRITQRGSGNAILIEDSNPDSSPFVIDSAGNVGIGTTTPHAPLFTRGNFSLGTGGASSTAGAFNWVQATNLFTFRNASGDRGVQMGTNVALTGGGGSAGGVISGVAGTGVGGLVLNGSTPANLTASKDLVITNTGNIGIGITNPSASLHVSSSQENGTIIEVSSSLTTSAALRITQLGTGSAIRVEDETNPDATPFIVAYDGRVGIGTASPIYKLHVRNGSVTNSSNFAGALAVIENSGSNSYLTMISEDNDVSGIGFGSRTHRSSAHLNWNYSTLNFNLSTRTSSAFLTFGTDTGTERMRITSGGLVGINTTTPQYMLDVNGSARITNTLTVTGSLNANGYISSYKSTASQEIFSTASYVAGDIIQGTIDGGIPTVNQYDLIFLDITGTWKKVDQTTVTSTKMLGIYLGGDQILLDGHISAYQDLTGIIIGPSIQNPNEGLPVYISSGTSQFNTTIPTSNYIRTLGYLYYNNVSNNNLWILKFRPSTDWYKI